jgi:hypothetical protein
MFLFVMLWLHLAAFFVLPVAFNDVPPKAESVWPNFTYAVCFPFRGIWLRHYQASPARYLLFGYLVVSFFIFSVSVGDN